MDRQEYTRELLAEDETLKRVKQRTADRGMPAISVPPELGRLLEILVKTAGATRVLEIGSLGGYSGICLARGLGENGSLLCLELSADFAAFARSNVESACPGVDVNYVIGPALHSLQALIQEGRKFDFFFVDADKENYPNYLDCIFDLAAPGAVICADNVMMGGRVADADNADLSVIAMRDFNQRVTSDPRLDAVLMPVFDGFCIARVK